MNDKPTELSDRRVNENFDRMSTAELIASRIL